MNSTTTHRPPVRQTSQSALSQYNLGQGYPQQNGVSPQQQQQQGQHYVQRAQSDRWSGDSYQSLGAYPASRQVSQPLPSQSTPNLSLQTTSPNPSFIPPMPPMPPLYDDPTNGAAASTSSVPMTPQDSTADLNFNSMRISDPYPRPGTSMSTRSVPPPQHNPPNGGGGPSGYLPRGGNGAASVYSLDMSSSGGMQDPNGGAGGSFDYGPRGGAPGPNWSANGGYGPQQHYQQGGSVPMSPYQSQPPVDYSNPYYAAASSVLGYPAAAPSSRNYPPMPPIPQNGNPPSQGLSRAVSSASTLSLGSNLSRQATTVGSANARRKGSFATVDARKPPYTKAFVDEYRARMKGDPDPEAQFSFAKYLIEAAKKIGEEIAQQDVKSGRKYRDLLLAESLKLIKKLATQQEEPLADAQFFLADLYGTGQLGLQVDHEKAYGLYSQASRQNHPGATYRTAVCNEIGAGTRKEPNRAVLFYRKAASLGDTAAMYKLGMVLLHGYLLQPKNVREAIHWFRRAASQADEDNPHALHELALLHEHPPANSAPYIQQDEAMSKDLFTQAAQLGYAPSQFKLGSCYEYGSLTCNVEPRRSIAWYTKAAEKGDPEAELALSGWYLTGSEGVLKQSDAESYLWARKAANKGLAKAEYAVGYYTEVGIGVKQDLDLAKRWYMRAAAQENKRAMQRLTELKRLGNKKGQQARPTREQASSECVVM